jgi:CRP-like cAMP-binding protein
MKDCFLTLDKGLGPNTVYPLMDDEISIGRSTKNMITLLGKDVSRKHTRLRFREGEWVLEDLGSANGIVCNGKRLDKVVLTSGDTFKIGDCTFRFIEREIPEARDQFFETISILSNSIQVQKLPEEKHVIEPWWQERLMDAISAIPFLSHLSEKERSKMVETATVHIFNTDEVIISEGDEGRSIYVVLDGRVRVFAKDYQDGELEIAVLKTNQFFGEMSFLTGEPRSASVVAEDLSLIIEFSYTSMCDIIKEHPPVKTVFLDYYHDRLDKTKEKLEEAGMKERRRAPRFRTELPVNLLVSPHGKEEDRESSNVWIGFSIDISLVGIMVGVPEAEPRAFPPEAPVHLEIVLPVDWGDFRTLGIVRWVKPPKAEREVTQIGIEFEGMTRTYREKLRNFLYGESHVDL